MLARGQSFALTGKSSDAIQLLTSAIAAWRSTGRDKNFTRGKVERRRAQLEESVAHYLAQLDTADQQEPSEELAAKTAHLREKLVKLENEMQRLAAMEKLMLESPDQQISLTDPDSRSMATSGRGSGVVGYNVQVAVDTEHHLIITHEVTNSGSDRAQLANIASQAKSVLGVDSLEAVADRGYFSGEEMCLLTLTCLCCRTRKRPGKFPGLIVFKDEWRDQ